MVRALDSQSRGPVFKTIGFAPVQLSLSYLPVPRTIEDFVVKSKLSPRSGSAALRQLNPIHKKGL